MPKITVIGKTGQLAKALAREGALLGYDITCLDRQACDLSLDPENIESIIAAIPAQDAIIIAAAYTAVDAAETEQDTALSVNAIAPGAIGRSAAKRDIPVVHISTDYVFNGRATTPYTPNQPIDPVNFYGKSKAQGEKNLITAQPNSSVLRTSWVYDGTGKNFLTTMLRLAQSRTEISVVSDQIGRPTYAGDLAKATLLSAQALIDGKAAARGVFHVSNSGRSISWADFASAIFEENEADIGHEMRVLPIPSTSYPTPAPRPAWSVMDISEFEAIFGMKMPSWQDALSRVSQEKH